MARRKDAVQPAEQPSQPDPTGPDEAAQAAQSGETAAQIQPEKERRPFKPVRSWTETYNQPLRYERFSDARSNKIMFRFKLPEGQAVPSDEVLQVMRSNMQTPEGQPTGLQFRDLRAHGKVWIIPNDEEGRDLADKIDFQLTKLASKIQAEHAAGR